MADTNIPHLICVNTGEYERAHGRRPHGVGCWAFFFERNYSIRDAFWFAGPYGKAVRAARDEAKRRGANEVWLGS
jgi:hypothetical protein